MNALDVLKALRAVNASLHRDRDGLVLNSPRGAVSPELAEEIRNNRTELLDLLKLADTPVDGGGSFKPLARPENLPLSLTQQRFWYLASVAPESAIYNLPAAFRLSGELNVAALEAAINLIIARHEILRTRIAIHNHEVVQEIEPEIDFCLDQVNLDTVDTSAVLDELIRQIDIVRDKPIPMDQAPMLKASLYHLGPQDHVLFWMPHHVIWDGWSFDIFLKELQQLYAALETGNEPELAPLKLQYADYALRQRQLSEGDKLAQHMEFWRTQLSGELPVLELTTDRPRPDMMSFEGGRAVLDIDGDTIARLTQIGRKEGATLFMVLLAGFYAFLYRYTGQEDLIVGSPVQSRIYEDTDNIIGVFVNTLVLRTQLSPSLSFRELVAQVKAMCISAYDHQDTPFEVLVEEFETERTMSRNPLYQVLFSYQDVTNRDATLGSLELDQIHIETSVAPTDLTVWLMETGEGLTGGFDYATDLFDDTTVDKMITHYCQILISGAENPLAAIGSLSIMPDSELAWLAQQAAGPVLELPQLSMIDQLIEKREYGTACCLHELIEAQVDRTPDAVAVGFEGKELSYLELDQRANQLAHHLQSVGVGPDVLVGVSLQRSEQMLVAVLGVLKAGGAYVPMDPEYPKERLAYMLEHSGVGVLVSQSDLLERLPEHRAQVVSLGRDWDSIGALSAERLSVSVEPRHLAYVIYTSGSTGKPKGVQVPHGAVVNFLSSMAQTPGLGAEDTLLAVTTLSFDIAVLELYLPLTVGARVEIASREVASGGDQLLRALQHNNISFMQATPATWRLLLSAGWEGGEDLKVLIGGEALPRDLANELIERVGGVWNMYGPTETTVWSTCEYVTEKAGPILIGRPIGNTQVYVLDEHRQLVPVGVPGELYIGGDGVVRGYLNAPELTEERFVKDPFSKVPQARMYRTGDQVRYHRDGRLEYLTRLDSQVKIRGFRIELGEIETCLLTHPAVKQGVVTVREDRPGDVRLVAYMVAELGQDVTVKEVRKYLRSSLPEYMIPQHVVVLDALPMTPNGKIDRKALPSPKVAHVISTDEPTDSETIVKDEPVPQLTPSVEDADVTVTKAGIEKKIAGLWQKALEIDDIESFDNFFELGGHSLSSMLILENIRKQTGVRVPARLILMDSLAQIVEYCYQEITNQSYDEQEVSSDSSINKTDSSSDKNTRSISKNIGSKLFKSLGLLK